MARSPHLLALLLIAAGSSFAPAQEIARSPQPKETVFALLRVTSKEDRESFERAQILVIKSRPTLELALARGGIAEPALLRSLPDPIAWLQRNLRVDFADDGKTLRIALGGDDSESAAIVNAVTDVCLQHTQLQRERKVKKLKDELDIEEDKIRRATEELRKARGNANRDVTISLLVLQQRNSHAMAVRREALRDAAVSQLHLVQKAKGLHVK